MPTFSNLTAKVKADTTGFVPKINNATRSLEGLGDESTQTAGRLKLVERAADSATTSFAKLSLTTGGLSFSFGGLTTSLTGTATALGVVTAASVALLSTLVPMAAVVGTVAAGVGSLAGAFGVLLGAGAVTHIEEIKTALKEAKAEIVELLEPLGEVFGPLILRAIEALPALVENILDAIGGVQQFRQALVDMGRIASRVIPDLVGAMFDIARVALPIFRDLVSFLRRNAAGAFRGMVRITRELAPQLLNLGRAFIDALPQIARLGTMILNTAIPALTKLLNFTDNILTMAEGSTGFVDFISTAISNLVTWVTGPGAKKLQRVADVLVSQLEVVLGKVDLSNVISMGVGLLSDIIAGFTEWVTKDEGGAKKIESLVTAVFGELGTAIAENRETIQKDVVKPLIKTLGSLIETGLNLLSKEEFQNFVEELTILGIQTLQTLGDAMIAYAKSDAFRRDLAGLSVAVAEAVQAVVVGGAKAFAKDSANSAVSGGNLATLPGDIVGTQAQGVIADQTGLNPNDPAANRQEVVDSIEVFVEGNTDVVENVSARVVEERFEEENARVRRGRGGQR